MALTLDTVYEGAQQTQYNPQPIGYYASNQVAATDTPAVTIMDDVMDANYDTLCTLIASKAVHSSDAYDAAVYVDGTLITILEATDGTEQLNIIVPANTNLKVNMSNQTNTNSNVCQTYVIIRRLQGSSSD